MSGVKCTYCNKFGHKDEDCWSRNKEAQYVKEEEDYLFMTLESPESAAKDIWYLDSACSMHLTGDKTKFKMLDETYKSQVRLGDDKHIQIKGKGVVAVNIAGKE